MNNEDKQQLMKTGSTWAKRGGIGLAAVFVAASSFYTTEESERHVVTNLGEFSHISEPGLNFKIPFYQSVTSYPVDIQEFQVGPKSIASKGNQSLQEVVSKFQYRIPVDNIEWIHKNAPQFHDRAKTIGTKVTNEVIGTTDTTNLANIRTEIGVKMLTDIQGIMDKNGMGLEFQTATLENFDWDPTFKTSIQENARVKNEIIRLEAELKRDEVEARRKVVEAQGVANRAREEAAGEADKNRTLAQGQKDAAIAKADGESYRVKIEGEARASAFSAEIKAFGDVAQYVDYVEANQWNGQLPQIVSGSGGDGMFIDLRSGDEVQRSVAPALPAPGQ